MSHRLVLFDFDGTLADTFPLFLRLLPPISERFGFRAPDAHELDGLRSMTTARILSSLGVPRWKLPAILRHARTQMAAEQHHIELFDGIAPMLQSLARQDTTLAVVSSNDEDTVRTVLGAPLCALIHTFVCGVGLFGKSAKIRRVLSRTGVHRSNATYVGDEERDIAAARRISVTAVAVAWGYAATQALAHAHVVCRTVAELEATLTQLPTQAREATRAKREASPVRTPTPSRFRGRQP